jgi:hypothetical protein
MCSILTIFMDEQENTELFKSRTVLHTAPFHFLSVNATIAFL